MPEIYPTTLQLLLDSDYSETSKPSIIETETDIGPVKTRVRFTKDLIELSGSIICSNLVQYPIFKNFYNVTLAFGSKTFFYNNPITQVQSIYQFIEPPVFTSVGPLYTRVSMKWREV